MQAPPLVSIIIPAYNQGRFLAETIESVLSQEYAYLEVIVLDDGSKDETSEIVEVYLDRVTAVRHDNVGENLTVNRGLEMARGDVICVVNADDPLLPGAIETAVATLEKHPEALAVYPDWVEIDPVGHVNRTIRLPEYDLGVMLLGLDVAVGPGVFLRRVSLERVGIRNPALRFTGDLDYWFRVARLGALRRIPAVLATHRVHPNAASSAAQGKAMAAEVMRLVKVSLRSPDLPKELAQYRFHILSKAHAVASHYCGSDAFLRVRYLLIARWYKHLTRLHAGIRGIPRPAPCLGPRVEKMVGVVHYRKMLNEHMPKQSVNINKG